MDELEGVLEFRYKHYSPMSPEVIVRIGADSTVDEAIQAFEQFLRGAGYYLNGEIHFAEYPDVEIDADPNAPLN